MLSRERSYNTTREFVFSIGTLTVATVVSAEAPGTPGHRVAALRPRAAPQIQDVLQDVGYHGQERRRLLNVHELHHHPKYQPDQWMNSSREIKSAEVDET
jgi:hypothetical protein